MNIIDWAWFTVSIHELYYSDLPDKVCKFCDEIVWLREDATQVWYTNFQEHFSKHIDILEDMRTMYVLQNGGESVYNSKGGRVTYHPSWVYLDETN